MTSKRLHGNTPQMVVTLTAVKHIFWNYSAIMLVLLVMSPAVANDVFCISPLLPGAHHNVNLLIFIYERIDLCRITVGNFCECKWVELMA